MRYQQLEDSLLKNMNQSHYATNYNAHTQSNRNLRSHQNVIRHAYNDIDEKTITSVQKKISGRSRNNSQLDVEESYPINKGSATKMTKMFEGKLRPRTAVF